MIKSKRDLNQYLEEDMKYYYNQSAKERMMLWILQDPAHLIAKYVRLLRLEEYYHNVRRDNIGRILSLYYFRKKNNLGNKLGFKIPINCFDRGLTIYHHGSIIVNETARIGKYCCLHGDNCIGNNGKIDKSPVIGDYLDMGIGSKALGDIRIGSNVRIGANAVVLSSFPEDNVTLVGIPATKKS